LEKSHYNYILESEVVPTRKLSEDEFFELLNSRLNSATLILLLNSEGLQQIQNAREALMAVENRASSSTNQSMLESLIFACQDTKTKTFISRDGENKATIRAKWLNWRAACWKQLDFDDLGMGKCDIVLNTEGQERLPVEVAKTFMEHIIDFLFADTDAADEDRRKKFFKGKNQIFMIKYIIFLVSCFHRRV
jgi:hypothetical protein